MIINVNDMNLPFMRHALTQHDGIEKTRELAESSWLVKTKIGYSILSNTHCLSILKDPRWQSPLNMLNELNPILNEEYMQKRRYNLGLLAGDEHKRLKKLLVPAFSHLKIENIKPLMINIIEDLLNSISEKSSSDLVPDVFNIYPSLVLCAFLDISPKYASIMDEWSSTVLGLYDVYSDVTMEMMLDLQDRVNAFTDEIIQDKRLNPGDDMISSLLSYSKDGDRLSDFEISAILEMIMGAGIHTIKGQLSLSMAHLLQNQNQIDIILEDNDKITTLLEEVARLNPTARGTIRIALEDIEYLGILFPKGTLVHVNIASANYDPSIFEDPYSVNTDRVDVSNKILTFGAGIHHCVGMLLAKNEIMIALLSILNKFPDIKLQSEFTISKQTFLTTSVKSLPVVFTPNIKV
jgi:cytochrome P450